MNVWPVIHRELRTEARHAFNYWLRVLGASVLLLIVAIMMLGLIAGGLLCENLSRREFATNS